MSGEGVNGTTAPGRPTLNRNGQRAPDGPWWSEPDRVEWSRRDVVCLALRGPSGAWCGYVRIPKGHPLHGVDYDELPVEVHGGLTFAGKLRNEDGFWLGFDCAHSGDVAPGLLAYGSSFPGDVYRPLSYVRSEVDQLARWVAAHGWPDTEDPNAPCLSCGHVLISHRPPLFGCLAYSRLANDWHGCTCEHFLTEW